MSEYTENLKLFKYDVVKDSKIPFSIERALNENWDKIDKFCTSKSNPFTLFDYKYSEYLLYNSCWLISDGQYNSYSMYPTAYEALLIEEDSTKQIGQTYSLSSGGNYIKRGLPVVILSMTTQPTDYDFVVNLKEKSFRLPRKTKTVPVLTEKGLPIVGNNKAIGLTNGTQDFGTTYMSKKEAATGFTHSALDGAQSAYGEVIGQKPSTNNAPSTGLIVGLTTDPNNSGIIGLTTSIYDTDVKLYFYVGEFVQDTPLINIGTVLQELAQVKSEIKRIVENIGMQE